MQKHDTHIGLKPCKDGKNTAVVQEANTYMSITLTIGNLLLKSQ